MPSPCAQAGITGRTSEDVDEVKDFLLAAIVSADSLMKAAKNAKDQVTLPLAAAGQKLPVPEACIPSL